jgi:hypothetical protein
MLHRHKSVFLRRAHSANGISLQRIAHVWQCCQWMPARKLTFAAGTVLVALAVALSLSTPQLSVSASGLGPQSAPAPHSPSGILITGSDGSQTGTASFLGNFTEVEQTPPNLFLLQRQADCSLNFITGSANPSGSTVSLNLTGNTPHYEHTLHQLASLKTTPDVYPLGCAEKSTGISSRPGVFVGMPQIGTEVSATVISTGSATAVRTRIYKSPYTSVPQNIETTLSNASALATADLNGDGKGDLVVVNGNFATSSFIAVMLGKSDGTFQAPASYTTAGNYTVAAVIDDVNGDGKLDVITVSADQQISVLVGKGDGTFQSAQSFSAPALPGYSSAASTPIVNLITADVNGDGKKDIICSNGLVLLGKGDGTFTPVPEPAFPYALDGLSATGPYIASGDINKDGKIDIVVDNSPVITVWKGNGDGTFTLGNSYANINTTGFINLTDLDGDGNLDLYTGLANGGFYSGDDSNASIAYVLMGNGDGTFQGAPALTFGAYNGNNLLDLNNDGVPDLVTQSTAGALTVQLGNGKGAFTPGVNIAPQASFGINGYNFTMGSSALASSFAVGDVTGDGKPDVVFVDNGLTAINPGSGLPITYPYPVYFVAIGNGDGTFQTAVPYAFPQIAPAADFDITNTVSGLQIADVNHDSHNDLIFAYNETAGPSGVNPYNQGIVVLPGNGNGTFRAPVLTSTYSSTTAPTTAIVPQIVNIGDLNGDMIPDLIVNSSGTIIVNFQLQTQLQAFVGNGDGTFKAPTTIAVGADAYATVLTDLNKNGRLDLAVLAETSAAQAELVIVPGKGDGTFGIATVSILAGGDAIRSSGLAAADFDGDGNVDLALIDSNDFSGIFYSKGDGTFTSVPFNGSIVPKDLINLAAGAPAVAVDLNKDGKPDILAGGVSLLNITGSTPTLTASTTTALEASQTSIAAGASVTFTATVAGASGSTGTPTGTVSFLDGTTTLGTGTLSSGAATYSTSSLAGGSHTITAAYAGDANFSASTSTAVAVSVTSAPSFTLSNGGNITVAAAATIGDTSTITVSPSNGFTGSVAMTCAVTTIPAGAVSPATCAVTSTVNVSGAGPASATATVTTTSTTTPGAYAVTVTGVSGSITQTTIVGVTVTAFVPPPSFALTSGGTITVAPGAITGNTATITVTPSGGFTGSVVLTAAHTSSPTGATNPPTFSFGSTSPVNITGTTAATGTLTVTTTPATTGALVRPVRPGSRRAPWYAAGGATLACVLLLGIPARRRRWRNLLGMLALLAFLAAGMGSCGGGGSKSKGNSGTTAGSYTITVTGTAGSATQTTAVNLTVN